ncbi:hypothetical protein NQ317_009665 [Molorchus minor]|uniref:Uncharacterized protein n=1 Tax=Molorchus minor TaxID=1323400 RepID=A0ABQ9JJX0_9CUCU|nr:hypothetical protein NQ317_009665 [Molorchus minor]
MLVGAKMKFLLFFMVSAFFVSVYSFGGNEDRFIKKIRHDEVPVLYLQIYESCFGEEVVKQIRKEMKQACAKCATLDTLPMAHPSTPAPPEERPQEDQAPNSVYHQTQPSFDVEKLHQAIMAFRPNPVQQPSYRPYPGIAPANFYSPPYGNPGFPLATPMFYPAYQQQPAFGPYGFPVVGQQLFGNRVSRDMDIRNQLEAITSKMSGKVRNVTCVMQELGYLDDNLEPNYAKISERIGNLPVGEGLRRDMQDGVTFCQQFSQCVPEIKKEKSPLSRELIRPMFFFKCYKHKKLEACIMKDVREKYSEMTDDELDSDIEVRRSKGMRMSNDSEKEIEDMSDSIYEFLYASDSGFDIDGLL